MKLTLAILAVVAAAGTASARSDNAALLECSFAAGGYTTQSALANDPKAARRHKGAVERISRRVSIARRAGTTQGEILKYLGKYIKNEARLACWGLYMNGRL